MFYFVSNNYEIGEIFSVSCNWIENDRPQQKKGDTKFRINKDKQFYFMGMCQFSGNVLMFTLLNQAGNKLFHSNYFLQFPFEIQRIEKIWRQTVECLFWM